MNTRQIIFDLFLQCKKISTDTRKLTPGSIFIALKGENFDGNTFAVKAIEQGCLVSIVDDRSLSDVDGCIYVTDSLLALQQLAFDFRQTLKIPVFGLTGSNGKTTTKELCRDVLSKKYKVHATIGNLNNHIGVPLTILSTPADTEILIVEMGANHLGEIQQLSEIACPTLGAITNIGMAHLEGFGSKDGILKGKTELYRYLNTTRGTIFVNEDDNILSKSIPHHSNIESYSNEEYSALGSEEYFKYRYKDHDYPTQLIGDYNLNNISLAIALGRYFDVDEDQMFMAITQYRPSNNRSQLKIVGSNKIILDAYNANPSSMSLAIENFKHMYHPNKVVILGDMFELGSVSIDEHKNIADSISNGSFMKVILVGKYFSQTKNYDKDFIHFESTEELKEYLRVKPIKYALILLKASRGMSFEKLIDLLEV